MSRNHLFIVLITLGAMGACKSSSGVKAPAGETSADMVHPASPATDAAMVMPGEAAVGDTSMCLVSGETFVVAADSPKAEHDGKTYYFCCPGCESKFNADPAKYLANMPTAGAAGDAHAHP